MKTVVTSIVFLALLTGLTFSDPVLADQAQADCEVHEHGDRKKNQSGPCEFSQRQGYIDIRLNNGTVYNLSPQGADSFTDQNGKNVRRTEASDNMHKYKWNHKNIVVRFNGSSAHGQSSGESVGREWDRGCSDAKGGSYDRSRHSDAYEEGWQACKNQQQSSNENVGREWDRGCSDAKGGSYDRSKHTDAYEDGWQACNNQQQNSYNNDESEWDRGCADAKIGSYDRSRHTDAYEEGWQDCNK